MLRAVREELDRIEQFLMRGDIASADLVAILTALRSKDEKHEKQETYNLKGVTTAPLRAAVFPKLYASFQSMEHYYYSACASGALGSVGTGTDRRYMGMNSPKHLINLDGDDHFAVHHRLACQALDRKDE